MDESPFFILIEFDHYIARTDFLRVSVLPDEHAIRSCAQPASTPKTQMAFARIAWIFIRFLKNRIGALWRNLT
jgi:hypothetical protein